MVEIMWLRRPIMFHVATNIRSTKVKFEVIADLVSVLLISHRNRILGRIFTTC